LRILILGGDGMLGHQLFKFLKGRHEVKVTLRQEMAVYKEFGLFNNDIAYTGIDARYIDRIMEVCADFHPNVLVNGVGIVKQRPTAKEYIPSLEINSLLPHRLSILCKAMKVRLVHISTDCVFSGKKGNYIETDPMDAEDLYGQSKFLGEVHDSHCITLRTSIIGRELSRKKSLLEWFLAEKGPVKGFKNAIFSGVTTLELSRIIEKILIEYPHSSGLYHVSSDPINKFDLLTLIKETLDLQTEIIPDESFHCDRSLDSTRFRREFNYMPPTWRMMVEELKNLK
jgi:dTDP-4-dehydrorhamnose reductase